jgi:VanZ family protein
MVFNSNLRSDKITLRVPVLLLVLAATAVPIELRPPAHPTLNFPIDTADFLANIAGYVPVGIVLGEIGALQAIIVAGLISTLAETSQLVMMYRDPTVVDVVANVIGAILGTVVTTHWRICSPGFRINRSRALVAATLAFALILAIWVKSGDDLNARGATAPGTLEAHWKFDESRGRVAVDSSGHGLHGRFQSEPMRVAGVMEGAAMLDGTKQYIEVGHSTALRLVGSMTISAWINSTSFPADDAAVVSQLHHFGYQLDTTVDRGPRTIGFKLTNACGDLMARYGATPLVTDTWYHVAGVYNADARRLDVFLDGQLDNGFLRGSVTSTQRSSRETVYIGRRSDSKGYEFAGSIDDVRIYSFALTKAEIAADMHGKVINEPTGKPVPAKVFDISPGAGPSRAQDPPCAVSSEPEDAGIPGAAATFGVLVAIAWVGLWPSARSLLCLPVSFVAGFLLLPATASTLRSFNLWTLPLLSLAGGASVAVAVHRQKDRS